MNPKLGPPPVEPVSDVAWSRIERELWTRIDQDTRTPSPSKQRWWIWLAVPVAAAAVIALVVTTRGHELRVADDAPARVVAGDAPSAVSFGDAHIALDARTAVVMASDRHTLLLENGAAWFTVGPRGDRPAFEVRAGDATVRVIGTRFRVARDGEHVDVGVDHGIVAVDFRGNHVDLIAGQSWSSSEPGVVAAQPPTPPAPAPTPPDVLIPTPAPANANAHVTPAQKPSPPECDADCLRYQALAKVEASQPALALKGYLELSQGSGKWASVALYAAGRLSADRHDPRAHTLLTIYLHRFPAGANAKDVALLLTELKGTP